MDNSSQEISEQTFASGQPEPRQGGLLATGGAIAALMASSCCIVPLALVTLGIGGTWVGTLTALEVYKPYFLFVTACLLAAGFWHVYFRAKPACVDDSFCARPTSSRITKAALWSATVLALLSATVNLWASLFY